MSERKDTAHARRRAGFTMAEVLIAVGILAVLLAVAVPGVLTLRRSLKMTELDGSARAIFLAAQNRLTALRCGGTAQERLLAADSGFASGEGEKRYFEKSTVGAAAENILLPPGAVEEATAGNSYVIVINPRTATVLAVYYAEHGIVYADTPSLADAAARRSAQVGYYDGGDIDYGAASVLSTPTLTVDNGDALRVTAEPGGLPGELWGKAYLIITVSSLDGKRSQEVYNAVLPNADSVSITLDAPETGKQFKDICPSLWPGEQVRISALVSGSVGGSGAVYLASEKATSETSSLFAGRTESGEAYIANSRHLQNLKTDWSECNYDRSRTQALIFSAVQTQEIVWPAGKSFEPIVNTVLRSYDGGSRPIRNLRVDSAAAARGYGLFGAIKAQDQTGTFIRSTLKNIRLVSPCITASAAKPLGALAGSAVNADIVNCSVYAEGDGAGARISGAGNTGGLVGEAGNCAFSYCFVGLPTVTGTGSAALGGLAGSATASTFVSCYAAVDQLDGSAASAALLAGTVQPGAGATAFTDCYGTGNLSVSAPALAGLAGGAADVTRCYAAACYLTAAGDARTVTVSALVKSGAVSGCAYLSGGTGVTQQGSGTSLDYEKLKTWSGGEAWTALQKAQSYPYRAELKKEAYPFPGLKAQQNGQVLFHRGSWPDAPALATDRFTMAYYELRETSKATEDGTVYTRNYGWYAAFLPDETAVDTLDATSGALLRDGYALASREKLTSCTLTIAGKAVTLDLKNPVQVPGMVQGKSETIYCYLLPLSTLDPERGDYGSYWQEADLTANAQKAALWFNPYFAKTCAAGAAAQPEAPAAVTVRTPRHLRALSAGTAGNGAAFAGLSYIQELDLDFNSYLDRNFVAPVGSDLTAAAAGSRYSAANHAAVAPFRGSYDGRGHNILGAKLTTLGLFQSVERSGTVRNLTLTLSRDTAVASAAFAGTVSGTLENCAVVVQAKLTISGANNAGILASLAPGTLRGCVVRLGALGSANLAAADGAGGLVGAADGTVEGCAVELVGPLTLTATKAGGLLGDAKAAVSGSSVTLTGNHSFAAQNAGALIGYVSGGTVTGCSVKSGDGAAMLTASLQSGGYLGGLAGTLQGEAANCSVQSGKGGLTLDAGNGPAGGFAGSVSGRVSGCFVRPADGVLAYNLTVKGGSAGGFVNQNNGMISGGCAVAVVTANTNAGGFAVQNLGVIQSAYANCNTTGTYAGGFVMTNGYGGTVSDCYALLTVKGSAGAGGFVYDNQSGSVSRAYTAAQMAPGGSGSFGPFAARAGGAFDTCAYLRSAYTGIPAAVAGVQELSYNGLADWRPGGTGFVSSPESHPYSASLQGLVYPFPAVSGLAHYGNWPRPPFSGVGIFYYEQYEGGDCRVYAVGSTVSADGKTLEAVYPFDDLYDRGGPKITKTGYGVFWSADIPVSGSGNDKKLWSVGGYSMKTINAWADAPYRRTDCTFKLWPEGTALPLALAVINPHDAGVGNTDNDLEQTYSVDTRFAKTIAANDPGKTITWGTTPGYACGIRTQAQLFNVGKADRSSFLQSYDIALSGFTGLNAFSGLYDGGDCAVTGLTTPLIRTNSGTVVNLTLAGNITASFYGDWGFIGSNLGTLENLHTAGSVSAAVSTRSQNINVGGLAGSSSGSIILCSSTAAVTGAVNHSGATGNIGGLVGRIAGGTVTESYARGAVTGSTNSFVDGNLFSPPSKPVAYIGGFAGANSGTVRNCYAAGGVQGYGYEMYSWPTYAGRTGSFVGRNNSGCYIYTSFATAFWENRNYFAGVQYGELSGCRVYQTGRININSITDYFLLEYSQMNSSIWLIQSEMSDPRNFAPFDSSVWHKGAPYPTLIENSET